MGSKEEWEEIEKSIEESNKEKFKKYKGIDITKIAEEAKNDSQTKMIKKGFNISKIILIIIVIIISVFMLFKIFTQISIVLSNMESSHNVNVEKTMEFEFEAKLKLISKDVDRYGNGEYYFQVKKVPEIQAKAVKEYGKIKRHDLFENFTKYLFDNWNSSEKEMFTVKEGRDANNMLNYELYIEIHNEQELVEATETIISFLDYAHAWNEKEQLVNSWRENDNQYILQLYSYIFLTTDNGEKIIPYNTRFQTAEEVRKSAKEQYRHNT